MKRLASIALVLIGLPTLAHAEEAFPLQGQIALSYRLTHSAFVPTESDDANFGSSVMRAATSFFWTPESVPSLTLSSGFNINRAVHETYNRAPFNVQVQPKVTTFSDINVGLNWNFARTGPLLWTAGFSGSIGISPLSRGLGQYFTGSPSLGLTAITPIGLIASLNGSVGFNINKDATVQVNDKYQQYIDVAGSDTGLASVAGSTNWSAALSYQAIPGLFISGSYFQNIWYSSVLGPDDEYTAPVAQTGLQSGGGFSLHGSAFSIRYQMKQLGGGAADAFNEAAEGASTNDDPWTNHVAISASLLTFNQLYKRDNSGLTNPFFNTESNLHGNSLYIVTLTGIL